MKTPANSTFSPTSDCACDSAKKPAQNLASYKQAMADFEAFLQAKNPSSIFDTKEHKKHSVSQNSTPKNSSHKDSSSKNSTSPNSTSQDSNSHHSTSQDSSPSFLPPDFHPHFLLAFWEMLLNGGKRFRPNLLLAVVDGLNPMLNKNAFLPALALECLHTYSLIHDDLPSMDNSPLRRGHPTLHTSYDETTAILVGDGLNTYTFYLLSKCVLPPSVAISLVRELSKNGGLEGMIIGQALDCHYENQKLSLEKLQTIHIHKTAKLIATSLKMGAIIANAPSELIDKLESYGLELGLFFQVRDDIIDAVQDSTQAGKTTQNDSAKNSYVNLLGLGGARQKLNELKDKLESSLDSFPKGIQKNLRFLLAEFFKEIK